MDKFKNLKQSRVRIDRHQFNNTLMCRTQHGLQQLHSMTYQMSLALVDQLLHMEDVASQFNLVLTETDILILISSYLDSHQLIRFIQVNRRMYELSKTPIVQVRILKAHIQKIRRGKEKRNQLATTNQLPSLKGIYMDRGQDIMKMIRKSIGIKELATRSKNVKHDTTKQEVQHTQPKKPDVTPRLRIKIDPSRLTRSLCIPPKMTLTQPKEQVTYITRQIISITMQPYEGEDTFSVIKAQVLNRIPFLSSNYPKPNPDPVRLTEAHKRLHEIKLSQPPSLMDSVLDRIDSLFSPRP